MVGSKLLTHLILGLMPKIVKYFIKYCIAKINKYVVGIHHGNPENIDEVIQEQERKGNGNGGVLKWLYQNGGGERERVHRALRTLTRTKYRISALPSNSGSHWPHHISDLDWGNSEHFIKSNFRISPLYCRVEVVSEASSGWRVLLSSVLWICAKEVRQG